MNQYDDAERGRFQTGYANQLVSFDGMMFEGRGGVLNVSPTDIDGFVQLDDGNIFIFFELKHSGSMPGGQEKALTSLADTVSAGGGECIVIEAVHNTEYPDVIIAKDAHVSRVYYMGRWHPDHKNRPLYELATAYIDYVRRKAA